MSRQKMEKVHPKGFRAGYVQLRMTDKEEFIKDLCTALRINTRTTFHLYKNGAIQGKWFEWAVIEKVFQKYGITSNIWENEK